jgi:hypothetical protein
MHCPLDYKSLPFIGYFIRITALIKENMKYRSGSYDVSRLRRTRSSMEGRSQPINGGPLEAKGQCIGGVKAIHTHVEM